MRPSVRTTIPGRPFDSAFRDLKILLQQGRAQRPRWFRPRARNRSMSTATCTARVRPPSDVHRPDIEDRLEVLFELLIGDVGDLAKSRGALMLTRNDRLAHPDRTCDDGRIGSLGKPRKNRITLSRTSWAATSGSSKEELDRNARNAFARDTGKLIHPSMVLIISSTVGNAGFYFLGEAPRNVV